MTVVAIKIQDPDIRTYVESLLSDKGFAVTPDGEADAVSITDTDSYETAQNKDLSIVLGNKTALEAIAAKHSIAFPIRAGHLAG